MRSVSLAVITLFTLATSSCELLKPKDQAAAYDPYGQQASPYGQATGSNPYGQAAANPYGAVPQTPAANPYGSYEQPQTSTGEGASPYTPPSPYTETPAYTSGGGGGSGRTVTVKSGDTLTSIARRNNTSVSRLRSANNLSGDLIRVGQKLSLP